MTFILPSSLQNCRVPERKKGEPTEGAGPLLRSYRDVQPIDYPAMAWINKKSKPKPTESDEDSESIPQATTTLEQ